MIDPFMKYGVMVVVGMLLGAIFFGGLWATVRHMPRSRNPGLLFLSSVILRSAIVLAGIWYFAAGDAGSIAACLLGFVALRLLATHGAGIFNAAAERREGQ